MKRLVLSLTCVAVLGLTACGEVPTTPLGSSVSGAEGTPSIPGASMAMVGSAMARVWEPFQFTVSGCSGYEDVLVTGVAQVTSKTKATPSGNLSLAVQVSARGTGAGAQTGADYIWTDSFTNYHLHFGQGDHFHGSGSRRTRLIGKGNAPNLKFDLSVGFYLDREGAVQIESWEARGCEALQARY